MAPTLAEWQKSEKAKNSTDSGEICYICNEPISFSEIQSEDAEENISGFAHADCFWCGVQEVIDSNDGVVGKLSGQGHPLKRSRS